LNAPDDEPRLTETIQLLLASSLALTHDGTIAATDGVLPGGSKLPLGVVRGQDDELLVTAYTDRDALMEPEAPTHGERLPTLVLAGDDLMVLAARNVMGISVNRGSDTEFVIDRELVAAHADRIARMRADAGERVYNQRTLITMRPPTEALKPSLHDLIVDELRRRGAQLAYLVEYAEHDRVSGDELDFRQLVVLSEDDEGWASNDLLTDARVVVGLVTDRETDTVAFASMPQADQITPPLLATEQGERARRAVHAEPVGIG
ncbi:MAG: SseB family protein, partial [Gaiellales bacterium]